MRQPKVNAGWGVVAAAFLGMCGTWIPHAAFGVFLPILSLEFGWSRGAIASVASLNLLLGGVLGFWAGAVSDRYGVRRILALSAAVTGTGYLLSATINTLWHFYLLLGVLLGVSMSGLYVLPTALVSRWFVEHRGLALGIVLAGLNLAYVAGGPLSAVLINAVGWRRAYLFLGRLVWLVAVPASFFMKAPPSESAARAMTPPGTATTLRSPAACRIKRRSSAGSAGATLPGGGSEGAIEAPFDGPAAGTPFREVLADRRLWLLALTWGLLGFANMMMAIHMVPYAKDQGITLERASLALTIYGVSSIGGRLLFGVAADRLGTRPTVWFCLTLQLMTFLGVLTRPPLLTFYFLILCFGLMSAGADTAVVKAASEVFGIRAIGAIMGFLSLGWRCGAAVGPAAAGFIYDATGSYIVAFGLATGALGVGLAFFTLGTSPLRRRADAF